MSNNPILIDEPNHYVISVNNLPYHREELWDEDKGIIRVWGKDFDNERINYIKYPKENYEREYIEKNVMPKYETCKLCEVGQKIEEEPSDSDLRKERAKEVAKYVIPAVVVISLSIFVGWYLYKWYKKRKLEKAETSELESVEKASSKPIEPEEDEDFFGYTAQTLNHDKSLRSFYM